jgi:hypothetical protein
VHSQVEIASDERNARQKHRVEWDGVQFTVRQEIADSNPQSMGKSKACYSQLLQITSLYKRLSR